jgi:hypothetical protein
VGVWGEPPPKKRNLSPHVAKNLEDVAEALDGAFASVGVKPRTRMPQLPQKKCSVSSVQ